MIIKLADPPIKILQKWAYTLALTHGDQQSHSWFYSNFINLSANTGWRSGQDALYIDYWRGGCSDLKGNNPYIDSTMILHNFGLYHNFDSFCSIIESLNRQGYAIMLFVEESLLKHSVKSRFFPHHILINSVNPESQELTFYCFGKNHGLDEIGSFVFANDSYRNIYNAHIALTDHIRDGTIDDEASFVLKYNPTRSPRYKLDLKFILESMQNYISCQPGYGHHNFNTNNFVFGLSVYDEIIEHFQHVAELGFEKRWRQDYRHIYALYEYRSVMASRLQYLDSKIGSNSHSLLKSNLDLKNAIKPLLFACVNDKNLVVEKHLDNYIRSLNKLKLMDLEFSSKFVDFFSHFEGGALVSE